MIGKKDWLFKKLTFTHKATLNDLATPTGDDDMSFQIDDVTRMEEGSSSVGNLGNTEQIFKDRSMLDGDVCRPDGTLKDASEMDFLNSLSEALGNLPKSSSYHDNYFFLNLKRRLPSDDSDEEESSSASDRHPKTKVSHISIVTIFLDYYYFLHALTSCYMRLPYVVYFYFDHALTMF